MATTRISKTFSLSIELVELMDSCDKRVNFSRVVEKLLDDYFKEQGITPNTTEN